jgi:arylsulfatase A-like enzyme
VLVVLDTVGADHLSLYDYPKATTPFLDSIAAESLIYDAATAPAPWTVPSHSSLLTGLSPAEHRAQWGRIFLDEKFHTLAEVLKERDFCTLGFSSNPLVSRRTGLAQGFQEFRNIGRKKGSGKTDRILNALPKALDKIVSADCRFFLFLNLMDAHIPYNTSKYGEQFNVSRGGPVRNAAIKWKISAGLQEFSEKDRISHQAAYDAAIRSLDDAAQKILNLLRERQLLENSIVVFTSDHGEGLGAHQELGHVISVWEEQLAVPLLIRLPGGSSQGQRVRGRTTLTSMVPTVLDWLAVPRPSHLADAPNLDQSTEVAVTADYRSYFSEEERKTNLKMAGRHPDLVRKVTHRHVLYCDEFKLIVTPRKNNLFFDLNNDPQEQTDLSAKGTAAYRDCVERYREIAGAGEFTPFADRVTDEERRKSLEAVNEDLLRSLGYVN